MLINNSNVLNTTLNNQKRGLYLNYSDSVSISGVEANSNTGGLFLGSSDYITVENTTSSSNTYGLLIFGGSYSNITDTDLSGNTDYDVYIVNTTNSTGNILLNVSSFP